LFAHVSSVSPQRLMSDVDLICHTSKSYSTDHSQPHCTKLKHKRFSAICLGLFLSPALPRASKGIPTTHQQPEQRPLLRLPTDDRKATSPKHIQNISRSMRPWKSRKRQASSDPPRMHGDELPDGPIPALLGYRVPAQTHCDTFWRPAACGALETTVVPTPRTGG
jgi:hypothetical protein